MIIKVSIECRIGKTVFCKQAVIEEWQPKRTDKQCNAVFHRLLNDMRSTVKAFNEPKDKPQEADLEKK